MTDWVRRAALEVNIEEDMVLMFVVAVLMVAETEDGDKM